MMLAATLLAVTLLANPQRDHPLRRFGDLPQQRSEIQQRDSIAADQRQAANERRRASDWLIAGGAQGFTNVTQAQGTET
jgi:hypothetical protein